MVFVKNCFSFRALGLLLLVFGGILASAGFATWPYGLRLLQEGFPAYQWPAKGYFVTVEGKEQVPALATSLVEPGDWTRSLFSQSQGKTLLVMRKSEVKLRLVAPDVNSQTRFNSFSMVKSLIGLLVLKARGDGLIDQLSDPIGRYVPEFSGSSLASIPIVRFLEMRSGLDFEVDRKVVFAEGEPKLKRSVNYNPFSLMSRLHMQGLGSVIASIEAFEQDKGKSEWRYQNINTAILAHLLEALYGRPVEQTLSIQIWKPSGAQTAFWRRFDDGLPVSAYCCLYATAEDWLRVGRFILNNESKPGEAFLPSHLWKRFMGDHVSEDQRYRNAYGDHLYHNVLDRAGEPLGGKFSYFMGNGGQMLYLMPEKDLVVVRFGEGLALLHSTLYAAWRDLEKNK